MCLSPGSAAGSLPSGSTGSAGVPAPGTPSTGQAFNFGKDPRNNTSNFPLAVRKAGFKALEAVNLPEDLKQRITAFVRAVTSQCRMSGSQALEPYRWVARWTVSNLGTNPKVAVRNSIPKISNQLSNLLPVESLPRNFNLKTTPEQKLTNQITKYARGGEQGAIVICSPLPEGEVDGTPFQELIKGGKVKIMEGEGG